MQFRETGIPGCYVVEPFVHEDERGLLVKTFHDDEFRANAIHFHVKEEISSYSDEGVLRGMHFQSPPHDHNKYAYVASGRALDVVVDLRLGSPTFGDTASFTLSSAHRRMVFVPRGLAHGFLALAPNTIMVYKTDTVYTPESDAGVRWDSIGFPWPRPDPILSPRDRSLPALADFSSPFRFSPS